MTGHYVSIWHDEQGLPRAWGSGPDQTTAEAMADIQREAYMASGRWDVRLVTRITHEYADADVSVIVATRGEPLGSVEA